MSGAGHWDKTYGARGEAELSWFTALPEPSLSLVTEFAAPDAALVDIGGGASRLVDALLDRGFADLTVLDLSQAAVDVARERLGGRADTVRWIVGDVTDWRPDRRYLLWHDRAAFHFLTDVADRAAYVGVLQSALAVGGHAILSTFADDGPERCSGLPVMRYAPEILAAELQAHAPGQFETMHALRHDHTTPGGATQRFQTSVFCRRV